MAILQLMTNILTLLLFWACMNGCGIRKYVVVSSLTSDPSSLQPIVLCKYFIRKNKRINYITCNCKTHYLLFYSNDRVGLWRIRYESNVWNEGPLNGVTGIIVHPDFRQGDRLHDIAILRSDDLLNHRHGNPIPGPEYILPDDTKLVAVGWDASWVSLLTILFISSRYIINNYV